MLQRSLLPRRLVRSGSPNARLSLSVAPSHRVPRCADARLSRWRDERLSVRAVGLRSVFARGYASAIPTQGDTIYALSTAQGRAGIAVVRISGPSCLDVSHFHRTSGFNSHAVQIYTALCPAKQPPKPRHATVRTLHDPSDASLVLDSQALLLYFPSPRTVTGEDVLELHIHGGPATVKAVLSAIPRCAPAPQQRIRYAEPGEFTKRAFFNDRLDLAQIESLSDTLDAETEQQRRAAVRGGSGALGRTYEGWREQLLYARGEIEALIDFSEDQHFDESQTELLDNVVGQVRTMLQSIKQHEQGSQRSELLRNGIRIALIGPPNVGKSSLMNLIVGREASIVSGEAGTTRDIVEASLDIRGYLCSFADTAGFRSGLQEDEEGKLTHRPLGEVEKEGIRRALAKAEEADIVVICAAIVRRDAEVGPYIWFDKQAIKVAEKAESCMFVVNKSDMVSPLMLGGLVEVCRRKLVKLGCTKLAKNKMLTISCKEAQEASSGEVDTGGVQKVIDGLVDRFSSMTDMPVDQQDLLGVTERQRQLLVQCRAHLEDFMAEAQPLEEEGRDADSVLAAEHLRYAADCLARITGKGEAGDVEDVLGVVFEK